MVAAILFVVFMVLWLAGGWYWSAPESSGRTFNHGLPWICVALLGYAVFAKVLSQ